MGTKNNIITMNLLIIELNTPTIIRSSMLTWWGTSRWPFKTFKIWYYRSVYLAAVYCYIIIITINISRILLTWRYRKNLLICPTLSLSRCPNRTPVMSNRKIYPGTVPSTCKQASMDIDRILTESWKRKTKKKEKKNHCTFLTRHRRF